MAANEWRELTEAEKYIDLFDASGIAKLLDSDSFMDVETETLSRIIFQDGSYIYMTSRNEILKKVNQ